MALTIDISGTPQDLQGPAFREIEAFMASALVEARNPVSATLLK